MHKRLKFIVLGLFLCLHAEQAMGEKKSSGVPRFDAAVDRGAAYLKGKVDVKTAAPGTVVLAAYALFKASEPVDNPIIQAGLRAVLESVGPSGFHPHNGYDHLYEAGLYAMFLADIDPDLYKPQIQQIANYVVSVQRADGSWADTPTAAADVSMCQYAVLAIWAAQRTQCQVSPEALDRVSTWLLTHRNPDGGWTYRPDIGTGTTGPNSSRNMTMASVSSLGVTRLLLYGPQKMDKKEKPKEELAFGVLAKVELDGASKAGSAFPNYKPQNSFSTLTAGIDRALGYETANFNPVNINANFPIYFYYSAERALAVSETEKVAGQEWFTTYGDGLLSLQTQDGSWNETHSGEVIGTSFAMLYFMRSTDQILKKMYGLGLQLADRGNPFGDKKKKEPTELDRLIEDISKMDIPDIDESSGEVADEIVRSVLAVDDPETLVGQEEKLKSLMKHPNAKVRSAAVWALGRSGDFKLVPLMLDGIRDNSIDVNIEAIQALRFIARKPQGFGETLSPFASIGGADQIANASPEDRLKLATPWRDKALRDWSNWYFSVRPFEDRGGIEELQLAVPVRGSTVEGTGSQK